MNIGALHSNAHEWANRAISERNLLELIAASPDLPATDPSVAPLLFSPDVRIGDLPMLVADGAIHPRVATTPEEQALVATALSQRSP